MKRIKQTLQSLTHHLLIWRSAWRQQKQMPKPPRAKGNELEFLPAVLEIQETPASPLGRTVGGVIILLFLLAVVWAGFGHIDIIAVAQGKIIPSDHSKLIQPLDAGIIRRIHIKEGQAVKKDDVLIELDAVVTEAEKERLQHEHRLAELETARLNALLNNKTQLNAPQGVAPDLVRIQQAMLQNQRAEHRARREAAKQLIEQRQAALAVNHENIQHLQQAVPLLREKAEAIKDMLAKKFVTRMQYLEAEEAHLEKAQELAAYRQQRPQSKAALKEAKEQLKAIDAEFYKNNRAQLTKAQSKAASLAKEVIKAETRTNQQRLIAPIDGIVQQLAVHTLGGVVTPAQQLMIIVPQEDQLEVEAWVQNKDIGFVDAGQEAEIKVEAFPFTRYGVIEGNIKTLSQDAVSLEDVGYVYAARVSMAKSDIQVGNKTVNLTPGMNVSVEIKTGKRRLLEYFLSPLLRGLQETAHER